MGFRRHSWECGWFSATQLSRAAEATLASQSHEWIALSGPQTGDPPTGALVFWPLPCWFSALWGRGSCHRDMGITPWHITEAMHVASDAGCSGPRPHGWTTSSLNTGIPPWLSHGPLWLGKPRRKTWSDLWSLKLPGEGTGALRITV